MFLFNLSLPEFLALFGVVSSVAVTLYLLDRVKKKHTVASLRFFTLLDRTPQYRHRRKLQQPWSLLLQILSMALLLLAVAQLRLGSRDRFSSSHVLILDSSAWMAEQSGRTRLIDRVRSAAKQYLDSVPKQDRVMVVRAEALATPATQFESDRALLARAVDTTQPGAAVLNLDQALDMAQQAQRLHADRPGEIVFVGSGRVLSDASVPSRLPSNLRVIPINGSAENLGIRKLSVRRVLTKPDTWEIFVAVKNYGVNARIAPLVLGFAGSPIGSKRFVLKPGEEASATFIYATRASGWLEARLQVREPFSLDDRAMLQLPSRDWLAVAVYSDDPANLKPVLSPIPNLKTTFLPISKYTAQASESARLLVLDRFAPEQPPKADTIWIEPPAPRSPAYVSQTAIRSKLLSWHAEHPVAAGLHAKDVELDKAEVFRLAPGDVTVASAAAGPIIVARPGPPKSLFLGFHPALTAMKYELTTPVLFANAVRWMAPETFTSYELTAGMPGTVDADLEADTDPGAVKVVTENGAQLPFTIEGHKLRFFSGAPGVVRISVAGRELVYSLTLPQAGDVVWKPAGVRTGVPRPTGQAPSARDIWPWLALAGALGLALDWMLFGRGAKRIATVANMTKGAFWRKAS